MVAKFMDLNKPWSCKYGRNNNKKLECLTFLCMIALRNKTVAHSFLPSFDNANGRPYQERLLRSKNFVSMVTWRHTLLLYDDKLLVSMFAWENSPHWFGDATTSFPAKWRLRNEGRNFILMTRHYPDLGSASDWLNQISHAARPIRSTTQIWVVTRHQYGISALVPQTSFGGETSGSVAKCRVFSKASVIKCKKRKLFKL